MSLDLDHLYDRSEMLVLLVIATFLETHKACAEECPARVFYCACKHRELTGVNLRLLFSHTVVRSSMQPGPRPSSAKQGLNGVCFSCCF